MSPASTRRARRSATVVVAAVVTCSLGRAEEPSGDVAVARALFIEARALVAAERYAEACPKFEESDRLLSGVGTKYNLADCYEHTSRTASAWAAFLDAAASAEAAGQPDRASAARARAEAIELHLPRLAILTGHLDTQRPGLEIRRFVGSPRENAKAGLVGRAQWDVGVPLDPGLYTVVVTAPQKIAWRTEVRLPPGPGTTQVDVPALSEAPRAAAPTDDGRRTHFIVAAALGGASVVGIGLGTYFGARAYAKKQDSLAYCDGDVCLPAGMDLRSDGIRQGNLSTAAFVVSAIALGGAAVAWLTAPRARRTKDARVRIMPLGAALDGELLVRLLSPLLLGGYALCVACNSLLDLREATLVDVGDAGDSGTGSIPAEAPVTSRADADEKPADASTTPDASSDAGRCYVLKVCKATSECCPEQGFSCLGDFCVRSPGGSCGNVVAECASFRCDAGRCECSVANCSADVDCCSGYSCGGIGMHYPRMGLCRKSADALCEEPTKFSTECLSGRCTVNQCECSRATEPCAKTSDCCEGRCGPTGVCQ